MDNIEIGKRIKQAREKCNKSQEELGKLLGLNKSTIQRYESGQVQRIKLPILENMSVILNVNPSWLAMKSDDPRCVSNNTILSEDEIRLLEIYRNFNDEGKEKLLDTASDMAQLDRYKKCAESDVAKKEA